MGENLCFLAGKKAISLIREQGLSPEMVRVIAGAAGGPRWLVLDGLDRAIFFSWLKDSNKPLFLIGSSIGSWRFAAVAQANPEEAYNRFEDAYIHQRYPSMPSAEDITVEVNKVLDAYLTDKGGRSILNHPYMRLNILTTQCRWPATSDNIIALCLVIAGGHLCNTVNRGSLEAFFNRVLFYDPRDIPPFFHMDGFQTHRAPITEENIKSAILASGAVPFLMTGIKDIPGGPSGIYRDGGLIDYHLDIPFINDHEGIVLFPHFMDRIIPGWFDKRLPWRRPDASNMDRVVVVRPSREFINRLPHRKIPDKNDFRFSDKKRIVYWKKVAKESCHLGDEFLEIIQTGKIKEKVRPLPYC